MAQMCMCMEWQRDLQHLRVRRPPTISLMLKQDDIFSRLL
jgi:hypothetical protein